MLGRLIAGRYLIQMEAGQGAAGVVYRALDQREPRVVAVKILAEDDTDEAGELVERFAREAAVLATLDHPNVVRYYGHGLVGRRHYLVMEWIDGETLAARGVRGFTAREAVALARGVAEALGAAHARGVVHRDIKPTNIMLVGGDPASAKVLDFGVARADDAGHRLTATGTVLGTAGYMAPEQARGGAIDARADLFALGAVLYQALTGRRAFAGDSFLEVRAKVLHAQPRSARAAAPEIPAELEALLVRLLAKDPADRPADGAAAAAELGALPPILEGPRRVPGETTLETPVEDTTGPMMSAVALIAVTVESGTSVDRREVEEIAGAHGARVDVLPGGVILVTLAGGGSLEDEAAQGARLALLLRRLLPPQARVALSVDVSPGEGVLFERTISRAARSLGGGSMGEDPPDAVRLDELTAEALGKRADLVVDSSTDRRLWLRR